MVINSGTSRNDSSYNVPIQETKNESQGFRKTAVQEPIAVIGMGCRLPGQSNSPTALWNFLKAGGIAANEAPESRFNLKGHHDGSKKPKTMRSPGGMWLESIDPRKFDSEFFEVAWADAIAMDPQQRQLLEVVYEAIENGGLTLESLSGSKIGCFVGSYAVDYADMQARDPEDRVPSVTIGVGRAILSNRISHFLNIKGPSMTIDTACSGSLVSLDVACRYLQTREINGAIVAASNLYLSPEHNMDSGPMKGASSLSGRCHTFDVKADGYIKGEAVNAVILKRLSDALRDKDPIRAVIRGTATNSDGHTPGIASPSSDAQSEAIRSAYANAGIDDFNNTTYLECHGTGTQAGDPTEVSGVASVFAPLRVAEKPLIIGSIKSNVGHAEPAAGISGLLKAILAIENSLIPGNPTFITPNPKIDFVGLKVKASQTSLPWPANARKRASVNSFGYGGSNAHVVLEGADEFLENFEASHVSSYSGDFEDLLSENQTSTRPVVLVLSANDELSLNASFAALRKHLLNPAVKVSLTDLAYTLSERRSRHFVRGFAITNNTDLEPHMLVTGKRSSKPPKIGFVFTGQGAQWSQMGKSLVENFDVAKSVILQLDTVLQNCAHPPSWKLYDILVDPRSPETLREPEFSQPICTALQLALLAVLTDWGVEPVSVVGHSSGEIAAAFAAGRVSQQDAIKIAYYRGKAAKNTHQSTQVGMMAVGLGPEQVQPYLDAVEGSVHIACYNSPESVTVSGPTDNLHKIRSQLAHDGHFCRMLLVDLAYHSPYMHPVGEKYEMLLQQDTQPQRQNDRQVSMFSSVTGKNLGKENADISYWKSNMVSPVSFGEAVKAMLEAPHDAADYLIELGPSGALAGPIGQIKKALPGQGTHVTYLPAWSRGATALKTLLAIPGQIFITGGAINLEKVNNIPGSPTPKVIVDLPNYSWNHSVDYWYESEASKDWRYRLFPYHDLLGSKVLGTSWHAPTWKKTLKVENVPWLADHKMGSDIVFPAAGFISMAIEAVSQTSVALSTLEAKPRIENPKFRLRNVKFPKALVLEANGEGRRLMLTLTPTTTKDNTWYDFNVLSLQGEVWIGHSSGLVRVDDSAAPQVDESQSKTFTDSVPGSLWYKAMSDVGYGFGPAFQTHLQVKSISGSRSSQSIVLVDEPKSEYNQSSYAMHPAAIDGCFQSCAPSLWAGNRPAISAVLIPAIIDELTIFPRQPDVEKALATTSSFYAGLGKREATENYVSNASVYAVGSGAQILQLTGLHYHKLDAGESPYSSHAYSRISWKPDVTMISTDSLSKYMTPRPGAEIQSEDQHSWQAVDAVLDLISHKKPHATVREINLISQDSNSVWLRSSSSFRSACRGFHYSSNDAKALLETQEKYSVENSAVFSMLDLAINTDLENEPVDLVILRINAASGDSLGQILSNAKLLLADGGHLVLISQISNESVAVNGESDPRYIENTLRESEFTNIRDISCASSKFVRSAFLATPSREHFIPATSPIEVLMFGDFSPRSAKIIENLRNLGWDIVEHCDERVAGEGETCLVLQELDAPIFPTMSDKNWFKLQDLIASGAKILWVTAGSQIATTLPENAMVHGLFRTIRNENPTVSLTTLDLESPDSQYSSESISRVLRTLNKSPVKTHIENEFVERQGIIYVARLEAYTSVNEAETDATSGARPHQGILQENNNTVRLYAERIGSLDSLQYCEVALGELPLTDEPNGRIEVELHAAGLNFKDVAITMGIVPENPTLLGLEGAGVVRRVSPKASQSYKIGDRVLVFEKGTFGNRVIATTERVAHIPDWMSFEEASTLPSVYLTAIYSLFNLADVQPGKRVLIHSATGGLGLASIQLCQHVGAEVFATVGNDTKRQFLIDNFGIPSSRIYNSRSTAFAPKLMEDTSGHGVDIILNSLTGDILDESWRCIAEGGTMVELGKKDMLDRNKLSMEPFGRNASYRCFDMSHRHVSDAVIKKLLDHLMDLILKGHVKPIAPITTFPFTDIPGAFLHMRRAAHIGKIVVTDKDVRDSEVSIRPAIPQLTLPKNRSILIIGGLKGLCGSLAVYLAKLGAKNLVAMGRSGYDDERSQSVLRDLKAEGCHIVLVRGDVSNTDDVRKAFNLASKPIGGIIQGAMVLRDQFFEKMTLKEYHDAISSKVQGTWNLHNVALENGNKLDFFTMLSSISGVVGQKGQANYAAANAFLDAFAAYRHGLGMPSVSVDLGAIEDVGYMSAHSDLFKNLDTSAWTPINEQLFHRIVHVSLRQQLAPVDAKTSPQLITSITVPQQQDSKILVDARFSGLVLGGAAGESSGGKNGASQKIQILLMMVANRGAGQEILQSAIDVLNDAFVATLRLDRAIEPARPLSSYGVDSLSAIELRNLIRMDLEVDLTILEITYAESLTALAEKVVLKLEEKRDAAEVITAK